MNDAEQARTDGGGGRCVRCGAGPKTAEVGELPAIGARDTTVTECISCFATMVADTGVLTEAEAKILAAEHLGNSERIVGELVSRPTLGVREHRASAVDKLVGGAGSPDVRATIAALDVPLPAGIAPE